MEFKKFQAIGKVRIRRVGLDFFPARVAAAQGVKGPATVAELRERLEGHVNEARFAAAMRGVKLIHSKGVRVRARGETIAR